MTKLQQSFTLTRHAMDRIRERFPLAMEEVNFLQTPVERNRKMYDFLLNSTIEKRVIHDTMFMQFVQEKYGYDKSLKFFANNDMLFIGIVTESGNYIVTVVNRHDYASKYLRPTAKKIQRKPDTFRPFKSPRKPAGIKRKFHEHLETDFCDD